MVWLTKESSLSEYKMKSEESILEKAPMFLIKTWGRLSINEDSRLCSIFSNIYAVVKVLNQ